jgi:muramoyltetrapeptide carboxypeptidase
LGNDLLCAHQDDVRFAHLQDALMDQSIDIIWLLQGGYGLTRLVPQLLSLEKPEKQKLFIGFSDGSVLHMFLNQVWDWPSLHASGASQISQKGIAESSIHETLDVVKKGISSYRPRSLQPLNAAAKKMETLTGKIVGGNLCLATCSLGTDLQVNPKDKILFLEDIGERGYRVDRFLMHLQQAHIFETVKAIIFGDFVEGEEKDGTSLVDPVLERFARETTIPVFRLPEHGHGEENFPLPFNIDLTFLVN